MGPFIFDIMGPMKKNPVLIGLAQALALVGYVSLVVLVMRSEPGGGEPEFLGIMTILLLFSTSALVSATITLGYPIYLFWKQREFKLAIKSVISTALWLTLFVFILITTLLLT